MPIFEYVCRSCSHTFQKLVRSSVVAGEVSCPSCCGEHVERKLSAIAISRVERNNRRSMSMPTGPIAPSYA